MGDDLRVRHLVRSVLVIALLVAAALIWSAPRSQVPVPDADADPEDVVQAYIEALNERDFETANAIDAMDEPDLGRFSRVDEYEQVGDVRLNFEGRLAHVTFRAEHAGSSGRDWWGYYLEKSDEGRWQIVDAGVA
jgi:hypothetical protein